MWIDRLVDYGSARPTALAASFAESRQQVLAENTANIDTPDYHTKHLDPRAFQKSLTAALERSEQSNETRLDLRGNAQFSTGPAGQIRVRPAVEPAPNVLFHDGTNARLEGLVADTNENALYYEMCMNFLRMDYRNLLSAVRGKVT